jgi:hypothetical protein
MSIPVSPWKCKGCGILVWEDKPRHFRKGRGYCSQECIAATEQCNLGDILESVLKPLHFIRSNDSKRVNGIGKIGAHPAAELHHGVFYFHRPRIQFAKCPICEKRIGRKSNFRYQLIIRHIKTGPDRDTITMVLKIVHRSFDVKNPIGAGPWSIHDNDLIDKIALMVTRWNTMHRGALKCPPDPA